MKCTLFPSENMAILDAVCLQIKYETKASISTEAEAALWRN